jgi:hypothetical protein
VAVGEHQAGARKDGANEEACAGKNDQGPEGGMTYDLGPRMKGALSGVIYLEHLGHTNQLTIPGPVLSSAAHGLCGVWGRNGAA